MLPSKALCLQKVDGLPDIDGQLQTFTDVYCIDIHCKHTPMFTLLPSITAVHNMDEDICIPPDVIIGQLNGSVKGNKTRRERFGINKILFIKSLLNPTVIVLEANLCPRIFHCLSRAIS